MPKPSNTSTTERWAAVCSLEISATSNEKCWHISTRAASLSSASASAAQRTQHGLESQACHQEKVSKLHQPSKSSSSTHL